MIRIKDGTKTAYGSTIVVGSGLLLDEDADGLPRIVVQNGGAGTTFDSALNIQATSPGNHRQLRLIDKATAIKYNWMIGTQPSGDDVEITPSTTIGGTTFSSPAIVFRRDPTATPRAELYGAFRPGSFANSQTNSGEAWIGRASDRNLGSHTIQLGGSSATGTGWEIVDRAWTKVIAYISGEAAASTFIVASTSNVGIGGTPLSGSKLTVTDATAAATGIHIDNTHGSSRGGYSAFFQGGTNRGMIGVSGSWLGTTASNLAVGSQTGGTIQFYTDGNGTLAMELDLLRNLTVALGGASNTGKLTANRVVLPVGADKWAT